MPVVRVISKICGVHEHIVITPNFAKLGYMAIASDIFFRQGNPAVFASIEELYKNVTSKVLDDPRDG